MSSEPFPIYEVEALDGTHWITFLSPDDVGRAGGLVPQAIVGRLRDPDGGFVPENFERNGVFVHFLHSVIRSVVPTIPVFVAAASNLVDGWVHVHDARALKADPEAVRNDILGSFHVVDGVIVGHSYRWNPEHWILSQHGIFTPHPEIRDRLLEAMREARGD
jgi:hypothetical protein